MTQRNGAWPLRASFNPARMARKRATAGWMMKRKLIGPPRRPTRFSHPRQKASSIEESPCAGQAIIGRQVDPPITVAEQPEPAREHGPPSPAAALIVLQRNG
jgi:hypothetical protein